MAGIRVCCPKCTDWRLARHNTGSEYEELHCLGCGYIAYIGLMRKAERRSATSIAAHVTASPSC